jgi:hypothetical protein
VPVAGSAFERMTTLVLALEARGLGATGTRTSYRQVVIGPAGLASCVLALAAAVAGVAAAVARGPVAPPRLDMPPAVAIAIVVASAAVFVLVLARAARALAAR